MAQTAIATTIQPVHPAVYSSLDSITLNYNEVQCLNMAIYFLTEQLDADPRHRYFKALRHRHVNALSQWLEYHPKLNHLRFDGNNSLTWQLTPLVDVEWLLLALDVGLTEDTLTSMAGDDANYDYDMMTYADEINVMTNYDDNADAAWIGNWQGYFRYYCQFLSCKSRLEAKLRVIVDN